MDYPIPKNRLSEDDRTMFLLQPEHEWEVVVLDSTNFMLTCDNSDAIAMGNISLTEEEEDVTIYYVDSTTGNNSNDGLSSDEPWQTIAAVNSATLVAGDFVLFKRGEIFSGKLNITDSGTADEPITIGAYGSGVRPKFDGSGETACIHVTGDYVHVTNVETYSAGVDGWGAGIYVEGASHVILTSCYCLNSAHTGIMIDQSDNAIISNCEAYNNGLPGMQFWDHSTNGYVYNCTSHHNGEEGINFEHGSNYCSCVSCVVYNNGKTGFDLASEGDDTIGIYYESCIAFGNGTVEADAGNGFTTFIGIDDIHYYKCISFGNVAYGWEIQGNSLVEGGEGVLIENCVMYDNGYRNVQISDDNVTMKNCIIQDCGWNQQIKVNSGVTGTTLDYNCYYRSDGTLVLLQGDDAYYSVSIWYTGTGFDEHGLDSNPQFVDAANDDFSLGEDSPCIGAGEGNVDMGAYPDGA